jgi:hypothetical protein
LRAALRKSRTKATAAADWDQAAINGTQPKNPGLASLGQPKSAVVALVIQNVIRTARW